MRAVDLRSPRGQHARGFRAGSSLETSGSMSRTQGTVVVDDFAPWVMDVYSSGTGRGAESYLVDKETGG